MSKKKNPTVEFRFYEIPRGESALALIGDKWKRIYGMDVDNLHFHNLLEIGYCYEGHGILGLDDERLLYDSGTFTSIPADYPHTTVSEKVDYWEFLFVDVSRVMEDIFPDEPVKQRDNAALVNSRAAILGSNDYPETAMLVKKIFDEYRNKGTGYREMIKYLLRILMLEIARINDKEGRSQNDDKVNRHFEQIVPALRYVDANYAGELKAADLARECNISEVHLRRLFCDCVNLPPMDYVNLVRIQKACDLMQKSNYSMDRVAEECGFSSTSTFNRNFVKFMNNTPYQWKLGKKSGKDRLRDYNILAIQGW